jgi:hypothetical protein
MTRRPVLIRAAVALAAVAAAPFLGIGAAQAQHITVTDSTGDVRSFGDPSPDPTITNGDFEWVRYNHRLHRVVVHAKYVDLARPATSNSGLYFASRMRTNEQIYRVTATFADGSMPAGETVVASRRRVVRCDTNHEIDYALNTIHVSIPRSCLSGPRWVRFTSVHLTFDRQDETYDHPHDDGAEPSAWTSKVYRG